MAQPHNAGPPPEGFMEYLTLLYQSRSLPPSSMGWPPTPSVASPTATPMIAPPPSTQPRSFNRPGRGTGGALAEKRKVSMKITAPATKRKSLVDADVETQSTEAAESASTGKAKRRKLTSKVNGFLRPSSTRANRTTIQGASRRPPKSTPSEPSQGSVASTPDPVLPERLPNPVRPTIIVQHLFNALTQCADLDSYSPNPGTFRVANDQATRQSSTTSACCSRSVPTAPRTHSLN